ncbi:MAG: hypothetical protein ACR2NM_16165, partial [Bythopirellula sp.]
MREICGGFLRSLKSPAMVKPAAVGPRLSFQPLETRVLLAVDFAVDAFTFADVTADQGAIGSLDDGDTVAFSHSDAGAPATAIFGETAFTTIQ